MTGPDTFVGLRVDDRKPGLIPGSVKKTADCEHLIWVAPSGLELLANADRVLCDYCAFAVVSEGHEFEIEQLTPGQIAEIRDAL